MKKPTKKHKRRVKHTVDFEHTHTAIVDNRIEYCAGCGKRWPCKSDCPTGTYRRKVRKSPRRQTV